MELPATVLKKYFGFEKFREPQGRIVNAILQGRDTLVIMPTGGGKSLCYQLPALMLPHLTIVVSPLIALMKDQVDALKARGIEAECLNSMQSLSEQNEVFEKIYAGTLKLVYIAPERFRAQRFCDAISRVEVSLFAVDEAHCLSQWGHDFRPDYLRLDSALAKFKTRPVVAAFTATATPDVREDISKSLKLKKPAEFIAGFARENLSFNIRQIETGTQSRRGEGKSSLHMNKIREILKIVEAHKTGIVYCATRKSVERVADDLTANGVNLVMYHGGMNDAEREIMQDKFMSRGADVAVATNAFGMGIDRADIRFVVHYEMPGSVEAYYQEAGRAGRDGAPAVCEMLFNFSDKRVQDFFIEGANPPRATICAVYETLRHLADNGNEVRISQEQLAEEVQSYRGEKFNGMAVSTSVSMLARYGFIERFDIPGMRIRGTRLLKSDLSSSQLAIPWDALEEKQNRDEKKLNDLVHLAYGNTCRQEAILRYFGDTEDAKPCGKCDVCSAVSTGTRRAPDVVELVVVKKILSGVARLSRKRGNDVWEPIFGRQRIIDCLIGSRAAQTLQLGHDKLSTYGILKAEGRAYVSAMMDALARERMIETVQDGDFPLCKLTEFGSRVMRGAESFSMEWPVPERASVPARARPKTKAIEVPRDPDVLTYEEHEFLDSINSRIGDKKKKKSAETRFGAKRKMPSWLLARFKGKRW